MNRQNLQPATLSQAIGLGQGWRRTAGIALMAAAVGCGLVGLWMFPQEGRVNLGWFLYLCSLVFFVTALVVIFGAREERTNPIFDDWKVMLWGSVILSLAIFMRLYLFSEIPFGTWFDEADIGLNVVKIIEGDGDLPIYQIGIQSQALHFTYLVSIAFRIFGVSTLSIRIVAVAFGLLAVIVAFFLGEEIEGPRFGLILSFFLAVGRWHVTFSRLGFITVSSPFFVLLTFFFLFRAMRTKKPLDFGMGGLALGLGLDFQIAFRLVPIAVVLFFGHWVIHFWRNGTLFNPPRLRWIFNLVFFMLGAGLATAPVAQYALRQPESFWGRASTVSIFQQHDQPDLGRALLSNTVKHLGMFNFRGDHNGRHNLPGEPMLDPVSGVLFVLGLSLALRRLKHPVEFTFLAIFVTGLAAGIFSFDFEAPQAQRSAVAIPAVYFFISLAVHAIWNAFEQSGTSPLRQLSWTTAIFAVGGVVFFLNAHTYFVRQAQDLRVWNAHNPAETLSGMVLRELDPSESTVYLSMFIHNHYVTRFLAPTFEDTKVIVPPDVLQLRPPGGTNAVLLVDPEQAWIVGAARELYPEALYTVFSDPQGNPALHRLDISNQEIQAIQGLEVRYWRGASTDNTPAVTGVEKQVEAEWPVEAPLTLPFFAAWEGILYLPESGEYGFRLEAPGEAAAWLDGLPILQLENGGAAEFRARLPQGNHPLKVQAAGGAGNVQLAWQVEAAGAFESIPPEMLYRSPPVTANGLVGSYYEGGFGGPLPAIERIDPFIDMYIHLIPLERPYGVEWRGEIEIPADGTYEFGLRINGQAQLYINDTLVVDAPEPADNASGTIDLEAGRNRIRLRFLDYLGGSRIHLYWTPPGGERVIVPSTALFPGQE